MTCGQCNTPVLCEYCENGELTAKGREEEKKRMEAARAFRSLELAHEPEKQRREAGKLLSATVN